MSSKSLIVLGLVILMLSGCGILFFPKYGKVEILNSQNFNDRIELQVKLDAEKYNMDKICNLIVRYSKRYLEISKPLSTHCMPSTICLFQKDELNFNDVHTFVFLKKEEINESIPHYSNIIEIFFSGAGECMFNVGGTTINVTHFVN